MAATQLCSDRRQPEVCSDVMLARFATRESDCDSSDEHGFTEARMSNNRCACNRHRLIRFAVLIVALSCIIVLMIVSTKLTSKLATSGTERSGSVQLCDRAYSIPPSKRADLGLAQSELRERDTQLIHRQSTQINIPEWSVLGLSRSDTLIRGNDLLIFAEVLID